jgi:alcohol dehydrogenase class IV
MQFDFASASRIIFGSGKLNFIGNIAHDFGNKAFIISGGPIETTNRLINLLQLSHITCKSIKISHEPTIEMIRMLTNLAKKSSIDMIIGIGGGSAIDSAKATAALLANSGDITDYLEVIGLNKSLIAPSIPLIVIPTTGGTGSEVTKNAVLGSTQYHIKVSLRSPYLLPKVALVDPELTLSVPPMVTAFTGLDALTQLIEPYTCIDPNPLTDALCLEGITRIASSLYRAFENGNDLSAREDMSIASLFSGLALANAKLGAVHGLAGPIGGEILAPHGAICSCLLPNVMDANLRALRDLSNNHPTLNRYIKISTILSGDPDADAESALKWIMDFIIYTKIPSLSAYGFSQSNFNKVIEKSMKSSSMKGNPVTLSEGELRNILLKTL